MEANEETEDKNESEESDQEVENEEEEYDEELEEVYFYFVLQCNFRKYGNIAI